MYEDKTLVCKDCGKEFVFTAGEQEFYEAKGFSEPIRCKECRYARKAGAQKKPRELFDAVCAECGAECKVPFQPVDGRPVLCSSCFKKRKEAEEAVD